MCSVERAFLPSTGSRPLKHDRSQWWAFATTRSFFKRGSPLETKHVQKLSCEKTRACEKCEKTRARFYLGRAWDGTSLVPVSSEIGGLLGGVCQQVFLCCSPVRLPTSRSLVSSVNSPFRTLQLLSSPSKFCKCPPCKQQVRHNK